MPRYDSDYATYVQFRSSRKMPSLVRKAARATGRPSSTAYLNAVVCEAIARDLGISVAEVKDGLPPMKWENINGFTPKEIKEAQNQP